MQAVNAQSIAQFKHNVNIAFLQIFLLLPFCSVSFGLIFLNSFKFKLVIVIVHGSREDHDM